jgi:4-hydroxybenzoyl-CoA thioesterase
MARITIELPNRFDFATEVPLYLVHINHGGHLDSSMLMSVVAEGRSRFFASLGYAESDVQGLAAFVGDAAVQYLDEAFYGETMVIEMAAREFSKHGFDLVFRMKERLTAREVARGKLGLVFFDAKVRKVAAVPAAFRDRLGAAGDDS